MCTDIGLAIAMRIQCTEMELFTYRKAPYLRPSSHLLGEVASPTDRGNREHTRCRLNDAPGVALQRTP